MKNRNIQFKLTAGLLIPLLLTCFAVFILAATPAGAGTQVAFNGTVSGQIPPQGTPLDQCHVLYHVVNFGNATELGVFIGSAEFIVNFCTGPNFTYTGTYDWFAANRDEIYGPFSGQLFTTGTPGVYNNTETATVTGGTGRFANATGTFNLGGQVNFITLSFVLPWKGTISSVGSTK